MYEWTYLFCFVWLVVYYAKKNNDEKKIESIRSGTVKICHFFIVFSCYLNFDVVYSSENLHFSLLLFKMWESLIAMCFNKRYIQLCLWHHSWTIVCRTNTYIYVMYIDKWNADVDLKKFILIRFPKENQYICWQCFHALKIANYVENNHQSMLKQIRIHQRILRKNLTYNSLKFWIHFTYFWIHSFQFIDFATTKNPWFDALQCKLSSMKQQTKWIG